MSGGASSTQKHRHWNRPKLPLTARNTYRFGAAVRQNGPAARADRRKGGGVQIFKRVATAVALMLTLVGTAGAHHSFAVFFDTDAQLVKVTGVVRDFQFRNPHGVITVAVPKGHADITWRAETNSPSILRRRGWTPDSLHVGDTVTLEGWRARDGSRYLRLKSARLADGRMVGQPPP